MPLELIYLEVTARRVQWGEWNQVNGFFRRANSVLHRELLQSILGDAVQVVCREYYTIRLHDADLKQRVYEGLLSCGIDPENETIIP